MASDKINSDFVLETQPETPHVGEVKLPWLPL